MFGKWSQATLVGVLLALGYLFTMNPGQVDFRLFPGNTVRASLALLLLLTFVVGFGVAFFVGAVREAFKSFVFWRHLRRHERRDEAHRLLREGRGQAVLGRPAAARRFFRKAYRKMPDEATVSLELSRAEAGEGNYAAAEKRLRQLLEKDPKNVEARSALLELARSKGDDEVQREALAGWLEADPESLPALRDLRDLHRRKGNWIEAVKLQEKVLARTQGGQAASREKRALAECLFLLARQAPAHESVAQLKRAIETDSRFAPAYSALGHVLAANGDEKSAAEALLQGYRQTGRTGLLLALEGLRTRRGEADEMLAVYKKQGRKDTAAALLRARLLVSLNRSEEALQVLKDVPEAEASALGRWTAGEGSFRLRSFESAARSFRRSLDAEDGPPPLSFACRSCGAAARAWSEECPSCRALDTLELAPGRLGG